MRKGEFAPSNLKALDFIALKLEVLLLDFFGFPLGTRATYCLVGGWGVFLRNIEKFVFVKKNKDPI